MACKYILYNEKTGEANDFTYEALIKLFQNSDYKDFSDIVYSKGTKQDAVFTEVMASKKEFIARASENKLNGEPDYTKGNTYTP